jgi:ATP-dependent DNA helicase 2 subunit 2
MADKEATVYIVDVGESMGDCHNGRVESDLDWSMRYVWDKISTTVAASRKTWLVGAIGLRTDETSNPQAAEGLDGYENISILRHLKSMNLTELKELKEKIQPSQTSTGDPVSAIILAIEMIDIATKKNKFTRRIILVTDATSPVDGDALSDVTDKLNESGIELVVMWVVNGALVKKKFTD